MLQQMSRRKSNARLAVDQTARCRTPGCCHMLPSFAKFFFGGGGVRGLGVGLEWGWEFNVEASFL